MQGGIYIVQARPETVHSRSSSAGAGGSVLTKYVLDAPGQSGPSPQQLCAGTAVGTKIGAGTANVIRSAAEVARFSSGIKTWSIIASKLSPSINLALYMYM